MRNELRYFVKKMLISRNFMCREIVNFAQSHKMKVREMVQIKETGKKNRKTDNIESFISPNIHSEALIFILLDS